MIDLVGVLILLTVVAVFGIAIWALVTYAPIPAPFKGIIILVAVLVTAIFVIASLTGYVDIRGPVVRERVIVR